jgi:gluconate 2-dehydrogenase gamma chain
MIALGLLGPRALQAEALAGAASNTPTAAAGAAPWEVLGQMLAHLLPGGAERPGAVDTGAIDYLRATLEHPAADRAWRERILDAAQALDAAARAQHGVAFTGLDADQREVLLRAYEQRPGGQRVLAKLLDFLIESLLADPIYGGNREQRGWQWLQHPPGFPRPPASRRWYQLLPAVQRRSKAT